MKYIYVLLLMFLATGCHKQKSEIEFTGTTPGIKDGVFIIKTAGDSTVYGENIKEGKFVIAKQQLKYPGYYMMDISDIDHKDVHNPFEVYLENGKYTIQTEEGKLYKYPKITSPSKIQEQLSAFYTLADQVSLGTKQEIDRLNGEIKTKSDRLSQLAYTQLLNKLGATETSLRTSNVSAFRQFVKQYPNSDISAHLMAKLDYEEDPQGYYEIYKTLTPAAKNSDEGKEIGDKLSHLVKLVVGAKAPNINGKTAEGKPFDPKTINTKFILIDFWRAGNDFSRRNHKGITDLLSAPKIKGKLSVVSISLDTKPDWWTNAIKEDQMTWTQVSDLKGDDSPNAVNWSITTIPTYYLLDSNWNIVERNIDIGNLDFEVTDYIGKHR